MKLIADIVYKTVDGEDIHLDLLLPDPLPDTPTPLVVEIHGGGWLEGDKDGMRGEKYVERGFITASVQYRLSPKWTHPAQIDDCRDAIRWLRDHASEYAIDPNRIGVHGGSAGGHLCALLGTSGWAKDKPGETSCRVQAVVDLCGPTNITPKDSLSYKDGEIYSQFLGGPISENLEAARDASAMTFVNPDVGPDLPPFLIMHCYDDDVVPVHHSEDLADALMRTGTHVHLLILEDGGHGFEGQSGRTAERETIQFFEDHLTGDDGTGLPRGCMGLFELE